MQTSGETQMHAHANLKQGAIMDFIGMTGAHEMVSLMVAHVAAEDHYGCDYAAAKFAEWYGDSALVQSAVNCDPEAPKLGVYSDLGHAINAAIATHLPSASRGHCVHHRKV